MSNWDGTDIKLAINAAGLVRVPGETQAQGGYDTTTSGGANLKIQSDGTLRRDASSRKYKRNIVTYERGLTELLSLNPKSFNSYNEDTERLYAGLIAEDVHDLGFTEYVDYGPDGAPEGLQYDHMMALVVSAFKDLSAKNDALEVKVTALENA
jgi:hypothetical protein